MAGKAGPYLFLLERTPQEESGQVHTQTREVRAELQEVGPAEPGRGNWTLRAWAGRTQLTGETHRGTGTE